MNNNNAMIHTFLQDVTRTYGRRYAFAFNFYPYFDPNFYPDAGSHGRTCNSVLRIADCLNPGCVVPNQLKATRQNIQLLTGRNDDTLWLGETGWSFPKSSTLSTPMASCPEWSSKSTLSRFYDNFLSWNLNVADNVRPPDVAFYFTMHDSINFGFTEHFGLINQCGNIDCKL